MSAFCEPVTTTSAPQASVSRGTAPRLETASTTERAPASPQTASNGSRSQTTPVEVSEWTRKTVPASLSARAARRSSGFGASPDVGERHDVAPERARHRLPALPELALRDGEHPLARGEEVDDRRLEGAAAGRREDEHLVLRAEHLAEPLLCEPEHGREVRRAVVEHGWESARNTSGGTDVGPGVRSFCGRATS